MRKFAAISVVLILSLILLPTVLAFQHQNEKRLIVHTTSDLDKYIFRLKGCEVTHELEDATSVACPENIEIPNSEPDAVLHVLDLTSDSQINADKVWPNYAGTGVKVAVLDTGIDYGHLQLSSNSGSTDYVNGHCFAVYAGDCGNGFYDDYGHGTHVSGIITSDGIADAHNGAFSKGVAPAANIWMAKVCDGSGSCYTSDIVAAIQYIVNTHVAKVMSISLGGGGTPGSNCDSDYLASQINWAFANGVVSVAAAGNSGSKIVSSPACASKAIAVSAVDSSDNLASFSSYGTALSDHGVAAPGVGVYSSVPTGSCVLCDPTGYLYLSGTSMATPHTSATIALMLQKNPSLAPADIRTIIFGSANCLSNKYGACPNIYIGYGRLDALAAVTATPSAVPSLSLSANQSNITTAQSSIITGSTSDIKPNVIISFTTNLGSLNPISCITGVAGSCSVTFSSTTTGTATITGSASGYTSGSTPVTISTVPVVYSATFSQSAIPSGITWGVTVGGIRYTSATSNVIISGLSGTVAYSYDSTVSGSPGTQFVCSTGCSGSVISTDNSKASTYTTRYQLTMKVSPAGTGTTSPAIGSYWYKSGSNVKITATGSKRYKFSSWSGSGTGSYTGNVNPATIAVNSPITEIASFVRTTTSSH